jgi:hypothetical protein
VDNAGALHVLHCAMPVDAQWSCSWAFNLTEPSTRFSAFQHALDAGGRYLLVPSPEFLERRSSQQDRGVSYIYECAWADAAGTLSNCSLLTSFSVVPTDNSTPYDVHTVGSPSVAWPLVASPTVIKGRSDGKFSHSVVLHDCSDAPSAAPCGYL